MVFHDGYAFQCFIRDENIKMTELVSVLGLSRQGIEAFYGRKEMEKRYVEKLKAAGYKIPGLTEKQDGFYNISNGGIQSPSVHEKEIQHLKEMLAVKDELIESLRELLKAKPKR